MIPPSAKLLIFAGSTRENSFNRKLAQVAADMARAGGAAVTQLELGDLDIPMYNADLEARATPPDVMKLKQILFEHPAWIICSPEYNGSYTALLKNTIDWASSPVKSDLCGLTAPGRSPARSSACSAHRPERWAVCARKVICCRC